MMYITVITITLMILIIAAHRYIPVLGLKKIDLESLSLNESTAVVDVRQYHTASRNPVKGSVNIPLAYLNRNWREVNREQIIVIATDRVELNISAKLLKRKGCTVKAYMFINDQPTTVIKQETAGISEFCKDSCSS